MKRVQLKSILGLLAIVMLAATMATGCASMRAAAARRQAIHQETANYVYNKPCSQVWPTARQLLFQKGYSVKDTGEANTKTLETEWNSDGKYQTRYLIQGMAPKEGQCKVQFTRNSRNLQTRNTDSTRDLDLEWELLQQVDQQAAAKIQQDAEVKAKAAAKG